MDSSFQSVRDVGETDPTERLWPSPQSSVRDMFVLTTAVAVLLAGTMAYGPGVGLLMFFVLIVISPFSDQLIRGIQCCVDSVFRRKQNVEAEQVTDNESSCGDLVE